MTVKLRIFGIKHGELTPEEYQNELDDFLPSTTSAIYLEPHSGSPSLKSVIFSDAARNNPTITMVLILRALWSRRPWRSHSSQSEWIAAIDLANERGIDYSKVGGSQLELIESVSDHWKVLSWLVFFMLAYFIVTLLRSSIDTIIRIGSEGLPELVGAIIGSTVWSALSMILVLVGLGFLFIRPFIRTTRPHRDISMLENAKHHWEMHGHEDVCLVVGKGHFLTLNRITALMDVEIIDTWDIDDLSD